jgi:threonylcarbamoyladenosine tRNA methylthiotransferase MtaB
MPQLDKAVIKARAARLRLAGDAALSGHLARHVGTQADALVERDASARLADFTPVQLEGNLSPAGRVARTHITGHNGTHLIGTLA